MSKVELTPAKLAELKQKAEAAETQGQSPWRFVKIEEEYHTYCEVRDMYGCQVVEDSTQEEAEHIAEADPATVLAMVEEIEQLRRMERKWGQMLKNVKDTAPDLETFLSPDAFKLKESEAGQ